MAETGLFIGEGGVWWEMDIPLRPDMQDKLTRGYLRRVNADGSDWAEPTAPAEPVVAAASGDGPPADPVRAVEPPKSSAPKAEWVGFAVRTGGLTPDDADGMTKADLVDRFGRH